MKKPSVFLLQDKSTISTMTDVMEIRTFMAEKGWHSQDRMSDMGWGDKVGYSIWFYRWDWHGVKTATITGDKVSFHDGTSNLSEINKIVKNVAKKALQAYEDFPDSIPFQNVKGDVVEGKCIL